MIIFFYSLHRKVGDRVNLICKKKKTVSDFSHNKIYE